MVGKGRTSNGGVNRTGDVGSPRGLVSGKAVSTPVRPGGFCRSPHAHATPLPKQQVYPGPCSWPTSPSKEV